MSSQGSGGEEGTRNRTHILGREITQNKSKNYLYLKHFTIVFYKRATTIVKFVSCCHYCPQEKDKANLINYLISYKIYFTENQTT